MFNRKQSLSWLVVLSIVTGALSQMLMLGAWPHTRPMRAVPPMIAKRLALSFRPHAPVSITPFKPSVN